MADVREWVDGSRTVRVYGLDAKWPALGTAQVDLETLIGAGLTAATEALVSWRGRHAETFADDANTLFRRLSSLALSITKAKRTLMLWPVRPGRPPLDEENAATARVEATVERGTSAADPDKLDAFRAWCEGVSLGLPSLTSVVNLDGVTAELTQPASVLTGTFGLYPPLGRPWLDDAPNPGPASEPEPEPETSVANPSLYIDLPDLSTRTTTAIDLATQLGAWSGVVALAFRAGDSRLISFITAHPSLADELLAGFQDHQLSGESSLVILLAYFNQFDNATGGGRDGEVSLDDLRAMAYNTELPPYVAQAASLLMANQTLFNLVETMNDGGDYSRDLVGWGGDGKISVRDIETFLEFNDHLAVMEQNFEAFDSAAHPGAGADGQVTAGDLEALAAGDDQLAASAAWLLAHNDAWSRLAWYETAKPGFEGKKSGDRPITASSLVLLAVDQQVYADHPNEAAAFVDRRFEMLMDAPVGNLADPDAIAAVFTPALTLSDDRAALMARVITEVANDGTIHNSGLNLAFAHGAAANMPLLDAHINAPFESDLGPLLPSAPGDEQQTYLNTHDFLREVSRDPTAATRLRQAVFDYGLSEVAHAPDAGAARLDRLEGVGRVQAFVDIAQNNALTDAVLDEMRAQIEDPNLVASPGSVVDYGLNWVPGLGDFNDIVDGAGISTGDGVDWLLGQLNADSEQFFDGLTEAERIDRVHKVSGHVSSAVWLAFDRYDSDPAVRSAARGQPFVDEQGALVRDMSGEQVQAFREWATSLTEDDGLTSADGAAIGAGRDDLEYVSGRLLLEDRRG